VGALLVLLPLLGVVLLNLPLGKVSDRLALPLGALLCLAQAAAILAAPPELWAQALVLGPVNVSGVFRAGFPVDNLARVMLLSIATVGCCSVLVARYSMADEGDRFRFANLLVLALAGLNGIVLVRDLLGLYVFLEITAVASFVLIALERGRAAFDGAFKYVVLSAVATAMIVAGLALFFIVAGSTSFDAVAAAIAGAGSNQLALAAVAFFLCGLGIKGGLVPFHGWLPTAYASAPAAVSVLLAGAVTKTSGVYTLIRLVEAVFGYGPAVKQVLLVAGIASIVVGAAGALGQKDMKRMLAFSSISQMGYVVLGVGAGPGLGLAGAVFHLFNHSIFKTLLFVNSAAVERQAGTRDMDELGGISARMPVTGTTSVLAMLSTAGVPPLSGFWSKLLIVTGVWQAGQVGLALAAVAASVLTLAYFLSMQRRVFFGKLAERCAGLKEADAWGLLPALVLAAVTVALGIGAPWLFETFLLDVESIL
jgi:multicomponent Na+:H+ antiporter subunit D